MPFDRISHFVPLYEPQSRFLECDVRCAAPMFHVSLSLHHCFCSFIIPAYCRLRPNLTHLSSHRLSYQLIISSSQHLMSHHSTHSHSDMQTDSEAEAAQHVNKETYELALVSWPRPFRSRFPAHDMHPACSAQLPARVPYPIRLPIVLGSTFNTASIHCIVSCLGDMTI
jgi:hypothetical protein